MLQFLPSTDHGSILLCLLSIPVIAIVVIAACSKKFAEHLWLIANLFSLSLLAASIHVLSLFRADVSGFQFFLNYPISRMLGFSFSLGLDGIGVWCIFLTSLVMTLAIYRARAVKEGLAGYLILLFLMTEASLGIFLALDLILYYLFWELMLIPNFFILYKYGQFQNKRAAMKLALFTGLGSLLMLVSIASIGQLAAFDRMTFFIGDLSSVEISPEVGKLLILGFLAAFFLKSAVFPFHSWLPDAHRAAPQGGSFDLALVLPKVGLFGAIRLLMILLPNALYELRGELIVLGVTALFYGALVAWKERDLKRFLAYSTISHVGLGLAGLASMTVDGISGCVFLMLGSAIVTGSMFLLVSEMERDGGQREVGELGGLAKSMPLVSALFLIFGLSSIGLPLTNGFIGEFLAIAGVFKVDSTVGIFAAVSVVFSALYLLSVYRQVFFGDEVRAGTDITSRGALIFFPGILLVFLLGIFPAPVLSGIRQTTSSISVLAPTAVEQTVGNFGNTQPRLGAIENERMSVNALRSLMFKGANR